MAYNEGMSSESLPPMSGGNFGGEGIGSKLQYHLEGLIPVILIIIIGAVLLFKFGIISPSTPVIGNIMAVILGGSAPAKLLVIGNSSPETIVVLKAAQNTDLVQVVQLNAQSLTVNPSEQISQFRIIVLDQTTEDKKYVSRQLGEAIKKFVQTGGRLIVVGNSGIERPEDTGILGWKATFGDIIPVNCEPLIGAQPGCIIREMARGKIVRADFDSKIMEGISQYPADGTPILFETFPVQWEGNMIAYIHDERTGTVYPAIVENHYYQEKLFTSTITLE